MKKTEISDDIDLLEARMAVFEKWVLANYKGDLLYNTPKDWNPDTEFFFKIGELQYRIKFLDIPPGVSPFSGTAANA